MTNEEFQAVCMDVFQGREKKFLHHIFYEDFEKILDSYMLEIDIKEDEKKLIYWWIWKNNQFREFTAATIARFVNNNRN